MSWVKQFSCDTCSKEFKREHGGGKTADFVPAVYHYPIPHFQVTDTRRDNYDFCSAECLEIWSLKCGG